MADSGVMEMYRDLSGLATIILYFFQILLKASPPPLHVATDDWQQKSAAGPLISLLRCGEHDVTCFVRPLHQNFLFCYKAANTVRTHMTHECVQIDIRSYTGGI